MSLIGMHSAARDGFTIPSAPVKWKYTKGSEKDFVGAPDWARLAITGGEFINKWFLESFCNLKQRHVRSDSQDYTYTEIDYLADHYIVIAQREPIADEDDLNECINSTEALITERGSRYGKFKDGAKIMRAIKCVMHNTDGWSRLTDSQREALDMIQHKIGRILNGDPAYDDNWKDIAGYSKLIADELNGEIK